MPPCVCLRVPLAVAYCAGKRPCCATTTGWCETLCATTRVIHPFGTPACRVSAVTPTAPVATPTVATAPHATDAPVDPTAAAPGIVVNGSTTLPNATDSAMVGRPFCCWASHHSPPSALPPCRRALFPGQGYPPLARIRSSTSAVVACCAWRRLLLPPRAASNAFASYCTACGGAQPYQILTCVVHRMGPPFVCGRRQSCLPPAPPAPT